MPIARRPIRKSGDVSLCVPTHKGYDAGGIDPLAGKPHPIWDSRRLWSLWDMINFGLGIFWHGLETLTSEITHARFAAQNGDGEVPEEEHNRINPNVQLVSRECVAALRLRTASGGSCIRLETMVNQYRHRKYTYKEIADELRRLFEEIQRDA
jgi:hypothetical protein